MNADPLAQHLRRVMWRGGDSTKKMKVYVTTTVNFGDKPAGCIAIAAIRETAERFGGDYPEASWFLKYRTYVDDVTAGANSMERLQALSKELEIVAKKGGFEFKETLMSGDPATDPNEPRKVLGLIWETQEDRLMVDVKLNLGPKRAGLKLEEDVDLTSNIAGDLRGLITKRELWRVAQGQYDPLGLLCASTDWFWIPGELNPADIGTRPTVLPADMGPETTYQRGKSWMRLPVRDWPVRKDFTAPPLEECRKDILHATCAVVLEGRRSYPPKINSRAKLERVYGYVFMAVAKLRKEPHWMPLGTFPTKDAKGTRSTGFRAPASKY